VNVGQLFQRYLQDWQKFALVGLGTLLVQIAAAAILLIFSIGMIGTTIFSAFPMALLDLEDAPVRTFAMLGAMGGFALVALIVGVVATGMAAGGLVGSIVGYRRGEETGLGSFWSYATRHFGKMIVIFFIVFLIALVTAIVNIIPVLGQIAYFLWLPTAFTTLGVYPAYLVINDGYGPVAAVGKGLEILTSQFGPAVLGGLLMLLFWAAFGVVGLVPVIGSIAVTIFGYPLMVFFFAERFESEVRPRLVA